MIRVLLLNPKGGSGKTTIATSLASWYAAHGYHTVLIDHDAQGSSSRWLRVRSPESPPIHGVAAYKDVTGVTRTWRLRIPPETERLVVDTPAGITGIKLGELVTRARHVIVPVLPSYIDIDAVSDFLKSLSAIDAVRTGMTEVAVVANRVRANTLVFRELERFLDSVSFPFVTRLRETQNYVRAGEFGAGIHELGPSPTRRDREQWQPLLGWLDEDLEAALAPQGAGLQRVKSGYKLAAGAES